MKKRGFGSFLYIKKWRFVDLLEPLSALPFAFGVIFVIENGLDLYGTLLAFALLFLYLPILVTFFDRVVR